MNLESKPLSKKKAKKESQKALKFVSMFNNPKYSHRSDESEHEENKFDEGNPEDIIENLNIPLLSNN